jgi:hypothetical protein
MDFNHQSCDDGKLLVTNLRTTKNFQSPKDWQSKFFLHHLFGVSLGLNIYMKKHLKAKEELWKFQYFNIYMKKYLKENEELWKFQYFTMQKYNL